MDKSFPFENFLSASAAAKAALQRGEVDNAAEIYRLLPGVYPGQKQVILVAAEGMRKCGFWTEAAAMLEAALLEWPKSASYLSALAELYRLLGDHARAAAYLQRYLDYDPRDPAVWLNLARLHVQAGNYGTAEAAYANALERDPSSTVAAIGRGDTYVELGEPKKAEACYRRAVMTEPQNATALFALGSLLMTLGGLAEAHDHLQRSLQIDPRNARAHVNLGLIYFRTGNTADAIAAARNALIVDKTLQIAHILLGSALAEQGELGEAARAIATAVTNQTHNDEALFMLAAVHTARDDKTAAELALQRIIAANADNREARHLLAALHGEPISTPIDGFAREIFDRIAPQFDNQQINLRGYRVPAEMTALIEDHDPERRTFTGVVDAGCGTGLTMSTLREAFAVERAIGVDVSPAMIELAREKDLYDELVLADAVNGLALLKGPFELLTAGDLFPYLGNLSAFMTAARAQLAPGGLLAYSIEVLNGDGISLAATGRFRHAPAYVEEVARSAGLRAVASRAVTLRRSLGQDVPGLVGLLQA